MRLEIMWYTDECYDVDNSIFMKNVFIAFSNQAFNFYECVDLW